MSEQHGIDLIERLELPDGHPVGNTCPGCGERTDIVALTDLVYTFEVCKCERWSYAHLVETVWHRACLTAHDAQKDATATEAS